MSPTQAPSIAMPAPDPGTDWVHLVPAGTFSGIDGRGPYHIADAAAVIAASMQGKRLVVDENHATDLAAKAGQPSPARGWITGMEMRADGLWGRVEWTREGRALVKGRAYRALSPVLMHSKDGTVLRVLRAALTNDPNLAGLVTLHARQPDDAESIRRRIFEAWGITEETYQRYGK